MLPSRFYRDRFRAALQNARLKASATNARLKGGRYTYLAAALDGETEPKTFG